MLILTEEERAQRTFKPSRLAEVKGLILPRDRWEEFVAELPKIMFQGTFSSMERALREARSLFPKDPLMLASDVVNGRTYLVDTGGSNYAWYVAEVGIRPWP